MKFKEVLRNYLELKGISQTDLALMLGDSQQAISDFLSKDENHQNLNNFKRQATIKASAIIIKDIQSHVDVLLISVCVALFLVSVFSLLFDWDSDLVVLTASFFMVMLVVSLVWVIFFCLISLTLAPLIFVCWPSGMVMVMVLELSA